VKLERLLSPTDWRRAIAGRADLAMKPQFAESAAADIHPPVAASFDPQGQGRRLRVLVGYTHSDYAIPRRGTSYETTAFRDPLYHLGCEVIEVRTDDYNRRHGPAGVSAVLTEMAFRHRPDVVFLIPFTDELIPADLGVIRKELGLPVVAWFCDDHWRFNDFTVNFLPHLSAAVTTARSALPKYKAAGFDRVIGSQWSANHRLFRPLDLPETCDISFVGQPHSDRRELVARLRSAGLGVETRGFGWPEGRATLSEMVRLSNQSRLCLNFSNASIGRENQLKGRDFEIPAMRRTMLTAESAEIRDYFSDEEVGIYSDADDLVDKARELLRDEARRRAMAEAGYQRVIRDHTAEQRLAEVLTEVLSCGWV
jgi:hypothetical protein